MVRRARVAGLELALPGIEAGERAGMPKGLVACMSKITLPGTQELMRHKYTALILATALVAALALSGGCLFSKKANRPKESSAISSEVEETFRVRWVAATNTMSIYFDNLVTPRLTYTKDIKNLIRESRRGAKSGKCDSRVCGRATRSSLQQESLKTRRRGWAGNWQE